MDGQKSLPEIEQETLDHTDDNLRRRLLVMKEHKPDAYWDEITRLYMQYSVRVNVKRITDKTARFGSGQTKKKGSHGEGRHK